MSNPVRGKFIKVIPSGAFVALAILVASGLGAVGVASAASTSLSTSDGRFLTGSDNQGWWSDVRPATDDNTNYLVGRHGDAIFRDFFTFNLSTIAGCSVTAATLQLTHAESSGSGTHQFTLYNVTTTAATLNSNVGTNSSIYSDLGSGTTYGSVSINNGATGLQNITLNAAAVTAINAANGGYFSIGGAITNLAASGDDYMFARSIGIANHLNLDYSCPDLTITKTHAGSFTLGQVGASYTITVKNSGNAPTKGVVTVTDTLPSGLIATAISGTGWSCTQPGGPCTRSNALAANGSYPPIKLTVNVAGNAAASLTNTATVSGGGETNTSNDTATDPATISKPAQCGGKTFDKVVVMTSPTYISETPNRQLIFAPPTGDATVNLILAHDSCIVAGGGSLHATVTFGSNILVGGPARDTLHGGLGSDKLYGGGAPNGQKDTLIGGGGTDTCIGTPAQTTKIGCEN